MKRKWISSLILGTLFGSFLALAWMPAASQADRDSRREEHEQAIQELQSLHFFHRGLGMHIAPDLIELSDVAERVARTTGIDNPLMKHRYGLTQVKGKVIGLFKVEYEGIQVGVLGCVACHSGKAAGQFIVGIGNKNIDVAQIGRDAFKVQKAYKTLRPEDSKSEAYKRVQDSAIAFSKELGDSTRDNQSQGLVPTSVIRKWFYRMGGREYPQDMPRGAVKVPHLFGYAEKRKVGQFSDGGGNGLLPGWGIAVELAAGQSPENVREYLPRAEAAEELLGKILPPKYPFAIDMARAERGQKIFENACARCHGTYARDSYGHPIYTAPRVIPWKVVKTDHDRLDKLDDDFLNLIATSPLSDVIQQTANRESYVAPRLHAVWARFPYLHNGSVPTIRSLLSPAKERPAYFSLRNAGEKERFDPVDLGLQIQGKFAIRSRPSKPSRQIYDTTLQGQSNQGHEFRTDLPDSDKTDLIEYLKTL